MHTPSTRGQIFANDGVGGALPKLSRTHLSATSEIDENSLYKRMEYIASDTGE
jgi:hypothetical protein